MNEQSTAEKASDKFFSWDTNDKCSNEEDMYFANSLDCSTAACTNLTESDAESSDNSKDEQNDENDDHSFTQP